MMSGVFDSGIGGMEADGGDYGWVEKLRYSKSFTAKLALSDPKIKEYYAMLATELLSYSRVRSHIGWAGITFSAGREQVAKFAISGKTLCLYLAADPEEMTGAKYRATAAGAKKYDKTPALLRIKSDGAARNAVRMIAAAMAAHIPAGPPPITITLLIKFCISYFSISHFNGVINIINLITLIYLIFIPDTFQHLQCLRHFAAILHTKCYDQCIDHAKRCHKRIYNRCHITVCDQITG